ncbi:MAG: pilin [Candidatus Saccharimonadales bacterium]
MKKIIIAIVTVFSLGLLLATPANAQVDVFKPCANNSDSAICQARKDKLFGPGSIWNNILNAFTFLIGAVSVVMIIIGGFRYAVSGGDQAQVTSAKNTIIYAVIGLIVAVLANAIVNFVLTNI